MTTFAVQLQEFVKKAGANADLVVKKVVTDIGRSLVFKSPVGDPSYWINPAPKGYVGGRFRANWQYGLNQANDTTTPGIDPNGTATVGRLAAEVVDKASGNIHYITNSLPYAERLEIGWSRHAPNGMVGLTVVEWRDYIAKAVAQL